MNHAARNRERQLSALTPPPPLYATTVVGYRAWILQVPRDDDAPKLRSLSTLGAWRPGPNHARCRRGEMSGGTHSSCDIAPGPCGECGLYAVRTVAGIPTIAYDPGYADYARHPVVVAGAVAGWGRVDVHQNGFRAEHAQILAITAGVGYRVDVHQNGFRATFNWSSEKITWRDTDLDLIRRAAEHYRVPYVNRDDLAAEALLHGDPPPTLEEIQ